MTIPAPEAQPDGTHTESAPAAKPPRAILAGGAALLISFAALAGAGLVLCHAWAAVGKDHENFWVVAVPGAATGVGTIILALVTVWISVRERKRDTWLRRQDVEAADRRLTAELARAEKQRTADVAERGRELAEQDKLRARREARKVVATLRDDGPMVCLDVTNAGSETIVNVWIERANAAEADSRGETSSWAPDNSEDDWQGQIYAPETHTALILPLGTWNVRGKLIKRLPNGNVTRGTLFDAGPTLGGDIVISWEDAAGHFWKSSGRDGLVEQTRAFDPGPHGALRFFNSE